MEDTEWIKCPVCANKTRIKVRSDTELKTFLYTARNVDKKR